jgi:lysophospholipase L1-like esterase
MKTAGLLSISFLLTARLATAAPILACLGDSNTATRFPFGPAPRTSWCDLFQRAYPTWTVHNDAVYGASLASMSGYPAGAGAPEQFQAAVAAGATVIVMAFGTNDAAHAVTFAADAVTDEYRLYLDAGAQLGVTVLVATTPPGFAPFLNATIADRIRQENVALRAKYRGLLVDFSHGFSARDVLSDGVHFNDRGEAIRLRRVVLAMKQRGLL